jgi:hypothetical protein
MLRVRNTPEPGVGTLRAAVEAEFAAPWIADNLEVMQVVERKVFNRHDLLENVALTFPGPFVR